MQQTKSQILILILILSIGIILGYVFSPSSSASEKALKQELEQKKIEIDGVRVEIQKRELILAERDKRLHQFDSLLLIYNKETIKRELEFSRERETLKRQLKQMTLKQKEELLTKRYETRNP